MDVRHFLSSDDVTVAEQAALVERALELKKTRGKHARSLEGRTIALLFEKPSTRTRVSFETGIYELGGSAITLRTDELQLGSGSETLEDTARFLSRVIHGVVFRTFGQDRLERLASESSVPVINALSDFEHPCQGLADVMTILERFDEPEKVRITYLGDGNNVCHSLLIASAKAGFARMEAACPQGFQPADAIVARAKQIGKVTGTDVEISSDPVRACKDANVLYTDVWASMGQERERGARLGAFEGFILSRDRLADAAPGAIAMHCLPAHRTEEIEAEVIDGPASVVWNQAENRLHSQKALLEWLVASR